uniref:DUF6868 family protein n=1 Tax=Candidatus Electronema sp. TaxID=2698783 RepID=UPI004057910C
MSHDAVCAVLLWSAVINCGILLLWFLVFRFAHDWLFRLHGRWFRIPAEQFDAIHYAAMAFYKTGVLLLNVAPYLALRLAA